MPADAAPPADQALEPPGVPLKPVLGVAVGFVVFLAAILALLAAYFLFVVKQDAKPREKPFPAPRLETSIDPRMVAATGHGPVVPKPPYVAPAAARMPIEEAMRRVADRGAQGYDPVAPAPSGGAQ